MNDPCPTCPFRKSSLTVYNMEAIHALHDGCEPSCHAVVGVDDIFSAPPTSETKCEGYERYMRDDPDYCHPSELFKTTIERSRSTGVEEGK